MGRQVSDAGGRQPWYCGPLSRKALTKTMISQPRLWALKIAMALAAAILLTKAAVAATVTVHAPDGEGRVFVDVLGTINDEDFKIFQEKTDQIYPSGQSKKRVIVTLLSYGGGVRPALQIAELIRNGGYLYPGDRTCTSSCALIWLAGLPRIVGNSAEIGFHTIMIRPPGRQPVLATPSLVHISETLARD